MTTNWQTLQEFQSEANEGYCWIQYKGRVTIAYHNHDQIFMFTQHSSNCFMTECISAVMPIIAPQPPAPHTDALWKELNNE